MFIVTIEQLLSVSCLSQAGAQNKNQAVTFIYGGQIDTTIEVTEAHRCLTPRYVWTLVITAYVFCKGEIDLYGFAILLQFVYCFVTIFDQTKPLIQLYY